MTTSEIYDKINEYPIMEFYTKIRRFISNPSDPEVNKYINERVLGIIYRSPIEEEELDYEEWLNIHRPEMRTVDGILIKKNDDFNRPFYIETLYGGFNCNGFYPLIFPNEKIDRFINSIVGDGKITYNDLLNGLKRKENSFLKKTITTN